MLRKFKKTPRYSLIWKEKNVVQLDLKKKKKSYNALCKARQNGVKRDVAGERYF